jgi:hypothetical protein
LAFNGTPVKIKKGERINAKKMMALRILRKYKLIQAKGED